MIAAAPFTQSSNIQKKAVKKVPPSKKPKKKKGA